MSAIPTADTCDIWEPTEHVQTDTTVFTPSFSPAQSGLACNFRHLTATQRAMAGLDMTESRRHLFLYGTRTPPSHRAVIVNPDDGTAWRLDGPATFHQTPVSDGHLQVHLRQELTPPAEIAAAYPSGAPASPPVITVPPPPSPTPPVPGVPFAVNADGFFAIPDGTPTFPQGWWGFDSFTPASWDTATNDL